MHPGSPDHLLIALLAVLLGVIDALRRRAPLPREVRPWP
jgi:hypothetical protein